MKFIYELWCLNDQTGEFDSTTVTRNGAIKDIAENETGNVEEAAKDLESYEDGARQIKGGVFTVGYAMFRDDKGITVTRK